MQKNELSLVGKLDTGFTKGFCHLLGWLKIGGLWLLGLITFAFLPLVIYEYGEGLADLSLVEWGFMPLLALLLWRHVHYCWFFSTGIWRGLSRLLICQGVMSALGLLIVGLAISATVDTEYFQVFIESFTQEDPISTLIGFASVMLAVYLAAPTSYAISEASSRAEPEISQTAKEANL